MSFMYQKLYEVSLDHPPAETHYFKHIVSNEVSNVSIWHDEHSAWIGTGALRGLEPRRSQRKQIDYVQK